MTAAPRRPAGVHVRAVRADLRRLSRADRAGGLARLALTLAEQLDGALAPRILSLEDLLDTQDLTALTRQLHQVLGSLAKLQVPEQVSDPVDELAERRARRRGA